MNITPYQLAQRYQGIREMSQPGKDHPLIQWWLSLCGYDLDVHDEVPWCSAFVNGIMWELNLPRTKSAAARSWLQIGVPVIPQSAEGARIGHDIVVLQRGGPGSGLGHVGFYVAMNASTVTLLGGNQGNTISVTDYPLSQLIDIRRITA